MVAVAVLVAVVVVVVVVVAVVAVAVAVVVGSGSRGASAGSSPRQPQTRAPLGRLPSVLGAPTVVAPASWTTPLHWS